jgi:hypothetical protein
VLAGVAAGCGTNPEEVRAAAAVARAGERSSYDIAPLLRESAPVADRLPAAAEIERQREEYAKRVADVSAEVFCSQLQTMLDTGSFPTVSDWETSLSAALVNASLEVPPQLHAMTEEIVGGTFDYLANESGTITTTDVENAQNSLC